MGSTSLEAQWEQRSSGHGQSVNGFGQYQIHWMSTEFWWARTVNKGAFLSWRRLEAFASSQGKKGPGRAELHQGAQLCKWCRALFLGLRRQQCPEKAAAVCEEKETEPNSFPISTPLREPFQPPRRGPSHSSAPCREFLPLVYSSLLRPGVCSLLSAHLQTEASRALGWCHQTPASSSGRVLSQTMTSVASGHPRTS